MTTPQQAEHAKRTAEERQLFEQLARNPVFRRWLADEESAQFRVLKEGLASELIFRAQGAVGVIDRIKSRCGPQQ